MQLGGCYLSDVHPAGEPRLMVCNHQLHKDVLSTVPSPRVAQMQVADLCPALGLFGPFRAQAPCRSFKMAYTTTNILEHDYPTDVRKYPRDVAYRNGEPNYPLQTTRTLLRLSGPPMASDDPANLMRVYCLKRHPGLVYGCSCSL